MSFLFHRHILQSGSTEQAAGPNGQMLDRKDKGIEANDIARASERVREVSYNGNLEDLQPFAEKLSLKEFIFIWLYIFFISFVRVFLCPLFPSPLIYFIHILRSHFRLAKRHDIVAQLA